jgi:CBS domain-containing protein
MDVSMGWTVQMPTVAELMTSDPLIVPADLPASDVARLMDFYRVNGVPVQDWDGELVGFLSQTDLVHALATAPLWDSWPGLTARQLMSTPAVTVTAGATADEAARILEAHRIHRLVVVAADGRTPIGILSASDLVRGNAEWEA